MDSSFLGRVSGEALALMFRAAPRLRCDRGPDHWTLLTAERGIDYNMAWIDAGPGAEARLLALGDELGGVGGLVQISSAAAETLAPLAAALGFAPAGDAPLMVCALDSLPAPAPRAGWRIDKVATAADLDACHELMVEAFGLDKAIVGRCMGPLMLDAPGLSLLLLRDDAGAPVSTVILVAAGSLVGVWSMATTVRLQRRGYGRHLLSHALAGAAGRASHAYLVATEAGQPLYASLGFEPVERYAMWVREEESAPAP